MRVAVIGLGKIGLPLAAQYASRGHHVTGVDISEDVVATVNAGQVPFPGEEGLPERLAELVPGGLLRATTDYAEAVATAEAVVVVVPLYVDKQGTPDFTILDQATSSLGPHLQPGSLVSYETTLPVGTTRNRWKPQLESLSGLTEGTDFHVVFSPERVLTGRVFADLRRYPKLVGGLTEAGAGAAKSFYEQVLEFDDRPDLDAPNGVWDLGSAEAAELAKLAETTYRDVNIGLANQFAVYAEKSGIDFKQVINACNSQPYSHIHSPGISVGGHCIPVYPRLYLHNDPDATIVTAAREHNLSMPRRAVSRLKSAMTSQGGHVAVLGAAYRGGVRETAFSGIFDLTAALEAEGFTCAVHDPLYSDDDLRAMGFTPHHLGDPADAVILHTDHREYQELSSSDFPHVSVVLDGRSHLDPSRFPGIAWLTLGNGQKP